jgi:hypothetical protein
MNCVFCASRSFHEAIYIHTSSGERQFFGMLLKNAVSRGDKHLNFPEIGQLLSGAAFRIDFHAESTADRVRIRTVTESVFVPSIGVWRAI